MAVLARTSLLLALLPVALCRLGKNLLPTQTNYATDHFDFEWGWSPVPTTMPNALGGLDRRQGIAPNATCGFISGLSTSVLTCINGLECGFNSGFDAAGCCSGYELGANNEYTLTSCNFFTACYDSTAVGVECDGSCQSNTHDLKCEQASQPYCITWSFTDIGYTNLGCYAYSGMTEYLAVTWDAPAAPTTTLAPAYTPTTDPTTAPTSSTPPPPSAVVFTQSTTSDSGGSSQSSGNSGTPTSATSAQNAGAPDAVTTNSESTGSTATATGTATDTTTASGSSGTSSAQGSSSSSSSSNTGAIAGGVVGGVVVLALIAGLIWFFMRRRNKAASPSAGEASQQPITQQPVSQHPSPLYPVTPQQQMSQHPNMQYPMTQQPNTQYPMTQQPNMQYPYSPVSTNTQGFSGHGSPQQAHEFPATGVAGVYARPPDQPQNNYQPSQGYNNMAHEMSSGGGTGNPSPVDPQHSNAYEVSSEGTASSRPLHPHPEYSNAPEVVQQQGGYRGVVPTGGGGGYGNPHSNYGPEPGYYGPHVNEMP